MNPPRDSTCSGIGPSAGRRVVRDTQEDSEQSPQGWASGGVLRRESGWIEWGLSGCLITPQAVRLIMGIQERTPIYDALAAEYTRAFNVEHDLHDLHG